VILGIITIAGCGGSDTLTGGGGSSGLGGASGVAGAPPGTAGAGAVGVGGVGGAAGMRGLGGNAGGAGAGGSTGTGGVTVDGPFGNNVDILIMIDDSSSMTEMQQKLITQLPTFILSLQTLSTAPSLHLAVVSSDLGAPGDVTSSIGCTAQGDQGDFHYMPQGTCTSTTLAANATFISDVNMVPNYTDPSLADVVQCIALLGDKGCGFEHQLGSIDRALGADGLGAAPSTNVGFLRPNAYLVILILTNEDDCTAPQNTTIYSLNGFMQNISNPDGPIANYRCNGGPRGAHLCRDPHAADPTAPIVPPLNPPRDAQGSATMPTLDLVGCQDNETGTSALTPVSKFVADIKALKPDPDNEILVATIAAPALPYTVVWVPEEAGQNTKPGELWPQVEHSCGPSGFRRRQPRGDAAHDRPELRRPRRPHHPVHGRFPQQRPRIDLRRQFRPDDEQHRHQDRAAHFVRPLADLLPPELDVRARAGRHAPPDQLHPPDESDVARQVDGAAAGPVGEGVPKSRRQGLAVAELEHHVADLQTVLGDDQHHARVAPLVLSDADELALELARDPRVAHQAPPRHVGVARDARGRCGTSGRRRGADSTGRQAEQKYEREARQRHGARDRNTVAGGRGAVGVSKPFPLVA
jgi:hypothetical protein